MHLKHNETRNSTYWKTYERKKGADNQKKCNGAAYAARENATLERNITYAKSLSI